MFFRLAPDEPAVVGVIPKLSNPSLFYLSMLY